MRRGIQDAQIVRHEEDDTLIGVSLGWDHCAEHEWGIKGIQNGFGIPEKATKEINGAEFRTMAKIPEFPYSVVTVNRDNYSYLIYQWRHEDTAKDTHISGELKPPSYGDPQEIYGAWSSDAFGLCVPKEDINVVNELMMAIGDKDLMIFLSGGQGPFQNAGLSLAIRSRMPQQIMDNWTEGDLDNIKLQRAFQTTGIKMLLKKAGKEYFALIPKWNTEPGQAKGKNNLTFWLNPSDQKNHQYGWYSLDDLKAWAKDEGPIMEMKKKVKTTLDE